MVSKNKFFDRLHSIGENLLDIVMSKECLGCEREDEWLCAACFNKIQILEKDHCFICNKYSEFGKTHAWCESGNYLDGLTVAADYKNRIARECIHKFKYNFIKELASPLAAIMIKKIIELNKKEGNPNWMRLLLKNRTIILPIPLSSRKYRSRGFNQAELLARQIGRALNVPAYDYLLKRAERLKPQATLKRTKRLVNLKNAFKLKTVWQARVDKLHIILIDDVATSGTTLNECAKELKKYGAAEVWAIVAAKG